MTVAVTGGTGFIGRAVIREFIRCGVQVRALFRPRSGLTSPSAPGLTWIPGNLLDIPSLEHLIRDADAVVNCAGAIKGVRSDHFVPANVEGVKRLVSVISRSKHRPRLLHISSLAARLPEISPYAASKRLAEDILMRQDALEWTIIRPPAVYGPEDRALRPLFECMRRGILLAPGTGEGRFSLIFVEDLARAVVFWFKGRDLSNRCFELHDGRPGGYSWKDVGETASRILGRPVLRVRIPPFFLRMLAGMNTLAASMTGVSPLLSPGKARELCHEDWVCSPVGHGDDMGGWMPTIDLEQGLCRIFGV
ncbi:MAG: NAD-dependent epimerase/dehydratase family protein [Deltaproteobacteria bacterium]